MKKILYVFIVAALVLCACKKDPKPLPPYILNDVPPSYLSVVGKYVRQHPAVANYDSIDFDKYRISKQQKCWYLRLPFKNKSIATDFILLQTDSLGVVADGRIIHLEKTVNSNSKDKTTYNGSIDIGSVDGKTKIHSAITGGYIESLHPGLFVVNIAAEKNKAISGNKEESFPMPIEYDELPEVVVVGSSPSSGKGGITYGDYMMLESMFGGGGGGTSSGPGGGSSGGGGGSSSGGGSGAGYGYGIYNPLNGNPTTSDGSAGPYGTGTNSPNSLPHQDPNVTLTYDESFSRPAIDLNAWMKCFTDIPDAGATSTITLYGDLPVDGDPSVGLNIWNGNTGHCFLQLSKTNGGQSVTQIIGFTAQSAGKAIINADAFVPSKIVDNAGHKYNCSITMGLTGAGLNTVINTVKSLVDMPYSIVNYDCLDFALNVINSVRETNPLVISKKYDPNDPFSNIATGPKLYNLLSAMEANGSPEAANIVTGGSRYIGVSHGPCN